MCVTVSEREREGGEKVEAVLVLAVKLLGGANKINSNEGINH